MYVYTHKYYNKVSKNLFIFSTLKLITRKNIYFSRKLLDSLSFLLKPRYPTVLSLYYIIL